MRCPRVEAPIGNLRKGMDQLIKQFFQRFERANASSDLETLGSLYADTFVFGGVNGVKVLKKEDFLKVVPRMKAHYTSMGLSETQLKSVEDIAINAKYVLAKAGWRMKIRDLKNSCKGIDAFATYLLEWRDDNTLSIIVQIDHQDLATVIKNQQTT